MAANILSDLVTETSCVLRENRGWGFSAIRPKPNPIKAVSLDLNSRDAEIDVRIRGDLIKMEARKIDPEFVDQSRAKGPDPGNGLSLVKRFDRQVALGATAAARVRAKVID